MHRHEIDVRRPAELPADDYWEMLDVSIGLRQEEAYAARAYETGVRRVGEEHAERLREIVAASKGGSERYESFRAAHRARLRTGDRRELVAESEAFIAEIGLDTTALE